MNNPVWEWLVRSRLTAYSSNKKLDGPSPFAAGPSWCFNRLGRTSTTLADGRVVLIAGEHEDGYDPDFYIYNDVVVVHPNGDVDIYGYPAEIFPPTDSHTATLVGDRIVIVGSLGYRKKRSVGTTQVLLLDVATFAISSVRVSGAVPGWIFKHETLLEGNAASLLVRGGQVDPDGENFSIFENIEDWRLHLDSWRWERLTARNWQRWEVLRRDRKSNGLWKKRRLLWDCGSSFALLRPKNVDEATRVQLDIVSNLYRPPIPHEQMPTVEFEFNVFRIKVDGIVVRYVEDTYSVQLTIEGELPTATVEVLTSDLSKKLGVVEGATVELRRLCERSPRPL
ncbi:MAG: hypothetical protein ACKVX7_02990 [Planctomycetota bacterium]